MKKKTGHRFGFEKPDKTCNSQKFMDISFQVATYMEHLRKNYTAFRASTAHLLCFVQVHFNLTATDMYVFDAGTDDDIVIYGTLVHNKIELWRHNKKHYMYINGSRFNINHIQSIWPDKLYLSADTLIATAKILLAHKELLVRKIAWTLLPKEHRPEGNKKRFSPGPSNRYVVEEDLLIIVGTSLGYNASRILSEYNSRGIFQNRTCAAIDSRINTLSRAQKMSELYKTLTQGQLDMAKKKILGTFSLQYHWYRDVKDTLDGIGL